MMMIYPSPPQQIQYSSHDDVECKTRTEAGEEQDVLKQLLKGDELALARRKVLIFQNALEQLDASQGRHDYLTLQFFEPALATVMLQQEIELVQQNPTDVDWSYPLAQLSQAEARGCVRSICWLLCQDCHLYVPSIQQRGLLALKHLCVQHPEKKICLVNYGGISLLVSCLHNHSNESTLQRLATALLISLVSTNTILNNEHEFSSIMELLLESHALHAISESCEMNLYKIDFFSSDDEEGNYERALACRQVPVVCRFIMHTFNNTTIIAKGSKKNKKEMILKRMAFMQTCVASLLNDSSVCKNFLRSILLPH